MKTINMKNAIVSVLYMVFFTTSLFAVGQSAVITLEFPAGAENTGLGECGVSDARNAYSIFWNPANLPAVYDQTYSNILFGHFHERLLPAFEIPNLYHNFSPFCLLLNDVAPNIDFSYGYFENFINFGTNDIHDELGNIKLVRSDETVRFHSIAFRAFDVLSAGISFKKYESRLAPGMGIGDDGIATGNAYDIGMRLGKRLPFFDIVEFQPSLGISFLDLWGDSAKYIRDRTIPYDPIPRRIIYGGSIGLNLLDVFEYTFLHEYDRSMLAGDWDEITKHWGNRFQITPFFCILKGRMDDPSGDRFEKTTGRIYTLNFRKILSMVKKISHLHDRLYHTDLYRKIVAWDEKLCAGRFKIKPNLYISTSSSKIHTIGDNDSREGQTRNDWSLGIGILGSFPDIFSKETAKPQEKPVEIKAPEKTTDTIEVDKKKNSIIEEDDDFVK